MLPAIVMLNARQIIKNEKVLAPLRQNDVKLKDKDGQQKNLDSQIPATLHLFLLYPLYRRPNILAARGQNVERRLTRVFATREKHPF
jgi:hypothetical protein